MLSRETPFVCPFRGMALAVRAVWAGPQGGKTCPMHNLSLKRTSGTGRKYRRSTRSILKISKQWKQRRKGMQSYWKRVLESDKLVG
ncbi:exported hypothetical protein [Candidatus Sulfotelmatobacter kueseliae]|uniref:Uncharacterized protein n=1 Tax=Candidatus Sulfotelmatobacter kueseliae TaxID=2042962 RepID=A0A2U3KGR2_9BACT|nr:exported hypothetical protein [Candidatus Sulfotelmatobacter kueseliae]